MRAASGNTNVSTLDVLSIGIKMVDHIESLHKYGYVHNNINPETIYLGLGTQVRFGENPNQDFFDHEIYSMDLVMSSKYEEWNSITNQRLHRADKKRQFTGNICFASPFVLAGHTYFEQERRHHISCLHPFKSTWEGLHAQGIEWPI